MVPSVFDFALLFNESASNEFEISSENPYPLPKAAQRYQKGFQF
jgi:hypothetical protein